MPVEYCRLELQTNHSDRELTDYCNEGRWRIVAAYKTIHYGYERGDETHIVVYILERVTGRLE